VNFFRLRKIWFASATLFLCGLLLGATYDRGLARGMDHAIEWGPNSAQLAIAVAISDVVYHLNLGYVAHNAVAQKLYKVIEQSDPLDASMIPRLHDARVINDALKQASQLGPLEPGSFDNNTLVSMYYNDLGFVDYIELAFSIFGLKIQSLYSLFFLLLGISVAAFVCAFPKNVLAAGIIVAICFGFLAEINSTIFIDFMPSVYGLRYPSVLAIVPALHLGLLLAWRQRLSPVAVLLATAQVLILILAIKLRGSAGWALIFLLAVAAVQFVVALITNWRRGEDRRIVVIDAIGSACRWPLLLTLGLVLLHGAYLRQSLHPVYDTDDVIARHGLWHTLYINLAGFDRGALQLSGHSTRSGDDVGYSASILYAKSHHLFVDPLHFGSPLTGTTIRQQFHDNLMRRVFLGYAIENPSRVLDVFLIEKPEILVRQFFAMAPIAFPSWTRLAGCGLVLAFSTALMLLPWRAPQAGSLLWFLPLLVTCIGVPNIIGGPDLMYMGDIYIVWPIAGYVGLPVAAALGIGYLRRFGQQTFHRGLAARMISLAWRRGR
jgi:hypothetical protein